MARKFLTPITSFAYGVYAAGLILITSWAVSIHREIEVFVVFLAG